MRRRRADTGTRGRGDAERAEIPRVTASPRLRVGHISAALVLAAVIAITTSSCGYTLVGKTSTLPASIKVIRFETLANQTQRSGVEQRLSQEIVKELTSRGRFSVQAKAEGANAVLSGAVTGFDLYAVAFSPQGIAIQYQIRITARVSLKTLPEEKVLWENPGYTFRDNYSFGTNAASYVDRENEAIDRVAEKFAASLVSTILEGF